MLMDGYVKLVSGEAVGFLLYRQGQQCDRIRPAEGPGGVHITRQPALWKVRLAIPTCPIRSTIATFLSPRVTGLVSPTRTMYPVRRSQLPLSTGELVSREIHIDPERYLK